MDGLGDPESNNPMVKFMKRLDAQIKDLFASTEVTKSSQIKGEQHLNKVAECTGVPAHSHPKKTTNLQPSRNLICIQKIEIFAQLVHDLVIHF